MVRLNDFGVSVIPSGFGLQYIRAQMGLTQAQLALELGLSLTTISRWERGVFEPLRKHRLALERYCRENKISYIELTTGILATALVSNHDYYTSKHCHRVCMIVNEVGKRIPAINLVELRLAAVLHDVGKLACQVKLLNKPGKYSMQERERIKEHAAAGENLVKVLFLLNPGVAKIVGQHHERIDGNGYHGVKDMLPGARIIAVADVFDALTTARSYKPERSVEHTLAILKKDKGLDQRVVKVLERVVRRKGFLDSLESDEHVFVYDNRKRFLI